MFYILVITVIFTLLSVFFIVSNARSIGLVSIPNHRSSHINATPYGAGMGFIFSFLMGVLMMGWTFYESHVVSIIAIVQVFILGIYDDYKQVSPKMKLSFIFSSSLIVFFDGFSITTIGNYAGETINVFYLSLPLTCFAIVGFTNAINLIDGIDGLATLISIIILIGISFVGYQANDPFVYQSSGILIAALAAFLFFNWNPAIIFMGDSGSLTLGFIIAILSIEITKYIDPISVLFIIAVPIFDTLTVMIRRKLRNLSIFTADKNHVHHIVLHYMNGNVKKTVMALGLLQLYFILFGIFIASHFNQEKTLAIFLLHFFVFYWITEKLQHTQRSL